MDKETIDLIESVRRALIEYGQQTSSSSVKKKTRKITSQLIWDAESYVDEIDNIKRTSKTDAEAIERIRSLVRTSEENALKLMTTLPDDTGHHIVQSRTGGDALTDIEYGRSGPIISRLSEKHQMKFGNTLGPGGNLPYEMSLSNAAHKFDDRATGLERESGIGKAIPKEFTAHNRSTAYHANMRGVDMTDDAAIEAALDAKVTDQINQARVAAEADFPRQEYLRQATGNTELYRGAPPKDLVIDQAEVLQSYRQLQLDKGGIRFRGLRRAAGMLPLVPAAIGAIQTGAQAATGDIEGAKLTAAETVAGEVPVVGDLAIADPVAAGTLEAAERDKARAAAPKTAVAKFLDDPINELEWLGKKLTSFGGGIRLGW